MKKYLLHIQRKRVVEKSPDISDSVFNNAPKVSTSFYFKKLMDSSKIVERSRKFISMVEERNEKSVARRNEIPTTATIRIEYVKCGKESCRTCEHGPYYYAYWRDQKQKLRKKYIGITEPNK
jgi:hypothetical protein